jgi:hypothetical protein
MPYNSYTLPTMNLGNESSPDFERFESSNSSYTSTIIDSESDELESEDDYEDELGEFVYEGKIQKLPVYMEKLFSMPFENVDDIYIYNENDEYLFNIYLDIDLGVCIDCFYPIKEYPHKKKWFQTLHNDFSAISLNLEEKPDDVEYYCGFVNASKQSPIIVSQCISNFIEEMIGSQNVEIEYITDLDEEL